MDLSRRSLILSGAALMLSPAIVRAESLMGRAWAPTVYSDGVTDDTLGIQAFLDGRPYRQHIGMVGCLSDGFNNKRIVGCNLKLSKRLDFNGDGLRHYLYIGHSRLDFAAAPPILRMGFDTSGMADHLVFSGPVPYP